MAQVKRIVDQELGFCDLSDSLQHTAFLCIVNQRVVGMVLAEQIDTAFKLLLQRQEDDKGGKAAFAIGLQRSEQPFPADIGIYQMWVHAKYRQKGIAGTIMDVVRSKMVFGYVVPVQRLAFSSPTTTGIQFAQAYLKKKSGLSTATATSDKEEDADVHVLVYDCLQHG